MRRSFLLIPLLILFGGPLFAVSNRSTSGSQQFIVICEDRTLRQKLAGAFDDVRSGLFAELGVSIGASTPIYVTVNQRKIVEYNRPTANLRWLDAPDGARVQLDILADDDLPAQRLQEHIVNALLLTLKYRDQPPIGGQSYSEAPSWLIEGLSEKIRLQNIDPDATLYRGLLNAKKVPDPADWLKVDPARLDVTSLGIYRAYACALVQFFLGEPNGNKKLLEFIRKTPPDPVSSLGLLAKIFPNLGANAQNLPKWWSLSLAKLSVANRYMASGGPETEAALEKILVIRLIVAGEKKDYSIKDYAEFIKLPERLPALAALQTDLVRLAIRAHPLYRPAIANYRDIIDSLQRGKSKGLADKIAETNTLRSDITQRLQEVSDYLTWFEATQAQREGPGEFDGYFRLMQSFQQPRPPGRDPISRYLDAMEAEMKN